MAPRNNSPTRVKLTVELRGSLLGANCLAGWFRPLCRLFSSVGLLFTNERREVPRKGRSVVPPPGRLALAPLSVRYLPFGVDVFLQYRGGPW